MKESFTVICAGFALLLCATAQEERVSGSGVKSESQERFQQMMFTTRVYRREALRLVLQEANSVAEALALPETLPISESNLVTSYISPPRLTQGMKALGNITTSNYTYYVSVDNKFSFLEQRFADPMNRDFAKLRGKYLWRMDRMDTNAAYRLATQWLAAASMDVKALNRDCRLSVRAYIPEGPKGIHFVPLYWVVWGRGGETIASVELLAPTSTLRQMRVEKSEDILRRPLLVQNLDELLSQTNAPTSTEARTNRSTASLQAAESAEGS